jgi:hypothetical protein
MIQRRGPRRVALVPVVAFAAACAASPLSPAAANVRVYDAPLAAPPGASALPPACREVLRKPLIRLSELDLTGSHDPFRAEREATASAGGNALVVFKRLIVPRQCAQGCPAASPITDCPPCVGAWYDVVFVSYACPARALAELPAEKPR